MCIYVYKCEYVYVCNTCNLREEKEGNYFLMRVVLRWKEKFLVSYLDVSNTELFCSESLVRVERTELTKRKK